MQDRAAVAGRSRASALVPFLLILLTFGLGCGRTRHVDPSTPRFLLMNATRSPASSRDLGVTARIDSLARIAATSEALPLSARRVREARAAGDSAAVVLAILQQARLHQSQGTYDQSLALLQYADRVAGRAFGSNSLDRASVLMWLGVAEKNKGQYETATAHFAEADRIVRAKGGSRHVLRADILRGQANLYRFEAGTRPKALECLLEAADIQKRTLDPDSPESAGTFTDIGLVLLQLDRASEARDYLMRALANDLRTWGRDHTNTGLALSMLGSANFLLGRYEEAEHYWRDAAELYDRIRRLATQGSNRIAFNPLAREGVAASLLARDRGGEAWVELDRALSTYMLEALGEAPTDSASAASQITLERVQRALDDRSAMIGWLDLSVVNAQPVASWAYVIRNHGPVQWTKLELLPTDPPDTRTFPRTFKLQDEIKRASSWPAGVPDSPAVRAMGHALWEERFAPVEPLLVGVDKLVVIQSMCLLGTPIELLRDDADRSLLDRFEVSYALSGSTHAILRERGVAHTMAPRALLIGDPPFSAEQLAQIAESPIAGPDSSDSLYANHGVLDENLMRSALSGDLTALHSLPRLAWTGLEISRIARLLGNSTVWRGADASEAAIEQASDDGELRGFNLIHIATHALRDYRIRENAALVLALAGPGCSEAQIAAPGSGTHPDGLLFSSEVAQLRLDADLVTLSGCGTYGWIAYGAMFGLGDGLFRAGARCLLVSLWPVEDRATSLLMTHFYELLSASPRMSATEALQRSKQWLRDYETAGGEHPYAHPLYWAPFVLVGYADQAMARAAGQLPR